MRTKFGGQIALTTHAARPADEMIECDFWGNSGHYPDVFCAENLVPR